MHDTDYEDSPNKGRDQEDSHCGTVDNSKGDAACNDVTLIKIFF